MAMKIAVANGVKIAMGTDIFVSGPMYGQNSLEVKYLIDAGMSPLEAVEAATANGPDTIGPQAPKSGQLREGYDADIIAFDTNPLEDLNHARKVRKFCLMLRPDLDRTAVADWSLESQKIAISVLTQAE